MKSIKAEKSGEFNGEEVITGSYKGSNGVPIFFTMYKSIGTGDVRFKPPVDQNLIPFLKELILKKP